MTKTLLVSATLWELEAFWEQYLSPDARTPLTPILSDPLYMGHFTVDKTLDCCITGVGVASVLINLAECPLETYDWVLGVGFVGSYTEALAVGDVVQVSEDAFADYGLEEENGLCFARKHPIPFDYEKSAVLHRIKQNNDFLSHCAQFYERRCHGEYVDAARSCAAGI